MKDFILYVWQLPQNLLGLLVIFFSKAKKGFGGCYVTKYRFGVSLGKYIIINENCSWLTVRHEQGHQKQSLYLGWLYLIIIGIPSATGNLLNRVIRFDYYKQPWEYWADKLGGIQR